MEGLLNVLMVPMVVFMVMVAPLWLILHYRAKGKMGAGLAESEKQQLQTLLARSENMQARVNSLEVILDAEVPNWRSKL
ncbi:MAG: envelope stress response membrane protein PspB [Vibrionaceae bacterium]